MHLVRGCFELGSEVWDLVNDDFGIGLMTRFSLVSKFDIGLMSRKIVVMRCDERRNVKMI